MTKENENFQIGEIVQVLKGRDSNKFAVVVGIVDERYIRIADGDKRKYDQAKKKNVRHVSSTGYISKEVVDSIEENGRVSNAKMRYVIQDYVSKHVLEENEKGE